MIMLLLLLGRAGNGLALVLAVLTNILNSIHFVFSTSLFPIANSAKLENRKLIAFGKREWGEVTKDGAIDTFAARTNGICVCDVPQRWWWC